MERFKNFSIVFLTTTLIGYLLWAASAFFLPLLCAIAFAYLVITTAGGFQKININGHSPPHWLSLTLTLAVFIYGVKVVGDIIGSNVSSLLESIPTYQERLMNKVDTISTFLGIETSQEFGHLFEKIDFVWITTLVFRSLTEIAGNAGLIAIYFVFLLVEYSFWDRKIEALFPNKANREKTLKLINKVSSKIKTYIRIKTLLSLLTGISSYIVLRLVGVDFPEFFAFFIFLLNFIPTIGSIIATVFPCLLAFIQFDTFTPLILVAVFLTTIQICIGNILEPRLMGSSFNLSSLVILLSLAVWGSLLGVIGMFLSVPFMVIISIVLANFEKSRWIAIVLSQNGNVD